jgi:GTPase SAR1 family protein
MFPGKSSLAVQFVENRFVDSYYPTIENTFSKTVRYKGQDYLTEIVDTAGQVRISVALFTTPLESNKAHADEIGCTQCRMNTAFSTRSILLESTGTCLYMLCPP